VRNGGPRMAPAQVPVTILMFDLGSRRSRPDGAEPGFALADGHPVRIVSLYGGAADQGYQVDPRVRLTTLIDSQRDLSAPAAILQRRRSRLQPRRRRTGRFAMLRDSESPSIQVLTTCETSLSDIGPTKSACSPMRPAKSRASGDRECPANRRDEVVDALEAAARRSRTGSGNFARSFLLTSR